MAAFTTRVELHDGLESDYERLHREMEVEGFARVIQSDNGIWYHLPFAEYNRLEDLTADQVRESAKRAAAKTGRKFAVLVSESTRRSWYGLEQLK